MCKTKTITIVNTLTIPCGEASVNRILSYARGLASFGNVVRIYSTGIGAPFGYIDGVQFYNLRKKVRSVLVPISFFCALCRLIWKLLAVRSQIVIVVSDNFFLRFALFFVCKMTGSLYCFEKSEYPFAIMSPCVIRRFLGRIGCYILYKMPDAMVIMTKPLISFYKHYARTNCRFLEMPMTVDVNRFSITEGGNEYGDYIAYCGNMVGNKDGVISLIDAFDRLPIKYHYLKLVLIGGASNHEDFERIQAHVKCLKNERIIFTGKVKREAIPRLLVNAKALALARPSSLQSEGGFPTKLGEYLSTGKPVIVTSVGDIPLYLNSENSFLVPPDDVIQFADAIESVFSNYTRALQVGARGKQLALNVFDAGIQSKRLDRFFNELL